MTIELSANAPTKFIEAEGINYAYRRLGQPVACRSYSCSTLPGRWTAGIPCLWMASPRPGPSSSSTTRA